MSPPKKPTTEEEAKQPSPAAHDVGSDSSTVDYVQKMVEAHPLLFRGKPPQVASDLPPGWYDLVDRLCSQIETTLHAQAKEFRILQIKEKFGRLRFYWSMRGQSSVSVDILLSSGGHARFVQSAGDDMSAPIDMLVAAAEDESSRTCEQCGAAAKLRSSRSGWLRVRCTKHARSK